MISWTEYFAAVGVMFLIYCIVRVGWWLDNRSYRNAPPPESQPGDFSGATINIAPLAERVHHLQENYAREAHEHPPDFKKPLLVEERRKEIAQMAYFQHLHENEAEDGAEPSVA